MPVDERSRHALYLKLEKVLGSDEAGTLMEHLPPVGWADVATKRDLEQLEVRMESRMEAMEHRILGTMRKELAAQTRTFALTLVGAFLTSTGIALAAARAL
jgi:hypothetical protein